MDKKETVKVDWSWLPHAMPGVARLMKEHRARLGDALVNECWKHGVVMREPGWFFAREGPLSIGTPWDDPQLANFAAMQVTASQALLMLRQPEAMHGTD